MRKAKMKARVDRQLSAAQRHSKQQCARQSAERKQQQFPSAFPNTHPDVAGIGRTLSRGLP